MKKEVRVLGLFRWRGAWNWKDITERVMSGFGAGLGAGFIFWLFNKLFGG